MNEATATDRLDIIALCQSVHWIYDHETWDELDEVFTETVSFPTSQQAADPGFDTDHYLDGFHVARADLKKALAAFKSGLLTQHLIAGHRVTITDDSAVCLAHSINIHFPADDPISEKLLAHGNEYRFDCVRTEAGWRIRGQVSTVRWGIGNEDSHDATAKQQAWLDRER